MLGIVALAGMVLADEAAWNPTTRMLAFSGPEGTPWLVEGSAQIKLTDGKVLATRDPRY
jgi:hypothetical protein